MLRIVEKASEKYLTKDENTPLVKKETGSYRVECGLYAYICGNGKIRRVS